MHLMQVNVIVKHCQCNASCIDRCIDFTAERFHIANGENLDSNEHILTSAT